MHSSQRDAYLSFATGYLWGTLMDIRSSGQISVNLEQHLAETHKFLKPILQKLYDQDMPVPNRFLLFETDELKSLLASLFSNDKIWRTLIENELKSREQQRSSSGTPQTPLNT